MSDQKTASNPMYDALEQAFDRTSTLVELIETPELGRSEKLRIRKTMNELAGMMDTVMKFKNDVTVDVIEGMKEVIVNAEARLDGKDVVFKSDMDLAA